MNDSETTLRILQTVGGLFVAGALLTLVLARFNLSRILHGELGTRYIGWLLLTPVYMLVLFTETAIGVFVVMLGMFASVVEYCHATRIDTASRAFLFAAAVITVLTVMFKPLLFAALPVAVLFLLTAIPILQNKLSRLRGRVRLISWGYIYTIWTLAHAVLMFQQPDGKGILLVIIVGCALADIGAYVVGNAIGKTVIAPEINPRKAWEGILGDLVGAAIAVSLFAFSIPFYSLPARIGLVLIIAIGSSWGDILSSMAKRMAEVKDWGNLIPGHGGVLDRLNSLIVVLPLVYYYLVLIQSNAGTSGT